MKANFENIYSKIGYLFYAIASEERRLSSTGYERLRKLIAQKWRPERNGDTALQSHLIECMYNSVWVGFHNHMDARKAFELFKDCYNVHNLNFGISLQENILVTVRAITQEVSLALNGQRSELMKNVQQLLPGTPIGFANLRQDKVTLSVSQ